MFESFLASVPWLSPYTPIVIILTRLIAILVLVFIAKRVGTAVIDRILFAKTNRWRPEERKARTLQALLKSLLRYSIYFVAALSMLDVLGVPAASIVASAGIVGLAVAFGAQNLVRDVLTGFFILFEDQFAVGDYIEAFGVGGVVEEVGPRVTKLRDFSGVLHILPNGMIDKVSNHNRGFLRALVDIRVAHEEDHVRVRAILEEVALSVSADVPQVVEGPTVLGIVDIAENGVIFRLWARTLPMEQWGVEREIRRRVKLAFDREAIRVPYPRTEILARPDQDHSTPPQ